MDKYIYGADTETHEGRPMSLQFYSEHCGCNDIIFVNEDNAMAAFFDWCEERRSKVLHVVYVHNLEFDLPEFFYEAKSELIATSSGEFEFTYGDWRIAGIFGKPTFARLTNRSRNLSIVLVDSFLWAQTSLARAADIFCPDLPKLKRIDGLGSKKFGPKDDEFVAYAMRDAEVAFHIGCAVERIHREFDIRQSVSLANMSAHIFRHSYLNYTIPQPSRDVIMGAWRSYHGGKNNVVPGAAPSWHIGITALDISSAYPYAMSELPAFSNKRLYKRISQTRGAPSEVHPFAVYRCSGVAHACDWPVIFEHGFTPIQGRFSDVWIQGMELAEALRGGEVELTRHRGFYYDHEHDTQEPSLARFVHEFYRRKSEESDPVLRYMYKIILNSLYGKFIQTRKRDRIIYTDTDADETVETQESIAGGMFHPFIASAITAHTRAYIHEIEHAHDAIHTATDGVYTYRKRAKRISNRPKKGIGSLQSEGRGDLCLLRNKCYILYSDEGKLNSAAFPGKRIRKYAKHGFQGSVFDLEKCIASGKRSYIVERPNKLRESAKRGLQVNEFRKRRFILRVGKIKV